MYFESDEVHACIVTCGGLCPGLNTVIREIVCGLNYMYGVTKILGIDVSDYSDLASQELVYSLEAVVCLHFDQNQGCSCKFLLSAACIFLPSIL